MSERPQPLKAINKLFEGKEPWQIVTMTASSVLAIVWAHSLYNAKEIREKVPIVRRKIDEKMAEINSDFRKDVVKRLAGVTVRRELPEHGLDSEQVMEEVRDHVALGGSVSGAVYHVSKEISKVACEAYSLTAYTNPLHADVFPGINKMEAEVVRMAINLFHGDDDCCGTVTTGGTESIIMACKAFRDLAYSKGISNPQIIVPSTVHTAFDKAAQYLGLSVKTIPVNPDTMTVDVEKVRKAIGRRTCLRTTSHSTWMPASEVLWLPSCLTLGIMYPSLTSDCPESPVYLLIRINRAGGLIAACWATMMFVGKARYVTMTDEIIKTARHIEDEIRKIPGLFVFGKPATSVIAFGSKKFDIFKMAELLHKKGWSLNALQFPSGIHICVTHAHTQPGVSERFLKDMHGDIRRSSRDIGQEFGVRHHKVLHRLHVLLA
ncbi:hypothetical protein HF086_012894 [Spodoptera exigua]|uniref:Sphingosine-1-phosphate lyase n=1 Tax=Spodoptera exigua TaxID=7107 RepID=A0A922SM07_SPOEX|nr:hypothetical protein HF086_012894 [Spodoptera exigua]